MTFIILAQSYTSSQRITKRVTAISEAAALRSVGAELEDAGFYPVSATLA